MKNTLNIALSTIIVSILIAITGVFIAKSGTVFGQAGNLSQKSCVPTISTVNIGDDLSTELVSTSSNRAWLRIEVNQNATNTVALALNDLPAVVNSGIILNKANTNGASTTPHIEMGLNTDFPYVGAVSAITNIGSTTALVTQCIY